MNKRSQGILLLAILGWALTACHGSETSESSQEVSEESSDVTAKHASCAKNATLELTSDNLEVEVGSEVNVAAQVRWSEKADKSCSYGMILVTPKISGSALSLKSKKTVRADTSTGQVSFTLVANSEGSSKLSLSIYKNTSQTFKVEIAAKSEEYFEAETLIDQKTLSISSSAWAPVTYKIKTIIYTHDFRYPEKDEPASVSKVEEILKALKEMADIVYSGTNELVSPSFDIILNEERTFSDSSDTQKYSIGYQLTDSATKKMMDEDFNGYLPALAFILLGEDTEEKDTFNNSYANVKLPVIVSPTAGVISHEFNHEMRWLYNSGFANVDKFSDTKTHPCIATDSTLPSGSSKPDQTSHDFIQNIYTYHENCDGTQLDICGLKEKEYPGIFFDSSVCTTEQALNPLTYTP